MHLSSRSGQVPENLLMLSRSAICRFLCMDPDAAVATGFHWYHIPPSPRDRSDEGSVRDASAGVIAVGTGVAFMSCGVTPV